MKVHEALADFRRVQDHLSAADKELRASPRSGRVRRALAEIVEAERALPRLLPSVSVSDAADRLRVSRPTVYSWLRNGVLDSKQVKGRRRISGWSLDALAREFDELRKLAGGRRRKQRRLASLASTYSLKSDRKIAKQVRNSLTAFTRRLDIVRD